MWTVCLKKAAVPEIGAWWRGRVLSARAMVVVLAVIFFGVVLVARATGHWQTYVRRVVYMELVPKADEVSHPM